MIPALLAVAGIALLLAIRHTPCRWLDDRGDRR